MKIAQTTALAIFLIAPLTAPALADDRAPTAAERSQIEEVLRAEGFTSWGEIERDDNKVWDVDDAIHADGREYDLELHRSTFAILQRDPD